MSERTFVMIKPEGVQRNIVGQIISRFERKGLVLKNIKSMIPDVGLVEKHYTHLKDKPFFNDLVSHLSSELVICMIWEGYKAVEVCRKIIGLTDPLQAPIGSIRGDFAVNVDFNVIHGSDSVENAEKEISLWYGE